MSSLKSPGISGDHIRKQTEKRLTVSPTKATRRAIPGSSIKSSQFWWTGCNRHAWSNPEMPQKNHMGVYICTPIRRPLGLFRCPFWEVTRLHTHLCRSPPQSTAVSALLRHVPKGMHHPSRHRIGRVQDLPAEAECGVDLPVDRPKRTTFHHVHPELLFRVMAVF